MKLKFKLSQLRSLDHSTGDLAAFCRVAHSLAMAGGDVFAGIKLRQEAGDLEEDDWMALIHETPKQVENAFTAFVDQPASPAKRHKPAHGGRCS